MKAVSLENISFSRLGRGRILEDISFSIEAGKKVAILGANGAGKTTLLSLISGHLKAESGKIELNGQPLRSLSPIERARMIALLPQIERLPFNYSVLDFVLMGRAPHIQALSQPSEQDYAMARSALAELHLEHLEKRSAAEISGGEFQLIRIARCLAQEADTLVLDEPTSLLDPANSQRVARELALLAEKNRTIIFSTHDLALVQSVSDLVLLLYNKKIMMFDIPSAVLEPKFLEKSYGISFRMLQVPTAYLA